MRFHDLQCGKIPLDKKPLPAFRPWLNYFNNRTLKASFFSRMPLKTESSVEVQFLIDSCRCVRQSNKLNNFIKDYDWLTLACFIREPEHDWRNFFLEKSLVWKFNRMHKEIIAFFSKKKNQ